MPERLAIDTNLLIDHQNGKPEARAFLVPLVAKGLIVVHPVVALEFLEGVHDANDLAGSMTLLAVFRRVHVKNADHELAVEFMASYRLSHQIDWPDCLIAATCIRLGLPLVTRNDKQFRAIRGLRIVRPY